MNCPNQVDGEPCNHCDICRDITNGSLEDVIEIDAASNNGVDEIREIRDKSTYAPSRATYKVYIIDEVHMLSTGAFNALLKTLEEPTENVVFILATTELHKIPATILSRVQRFEFKSIKQGAIKEHLASILEKEGLTFDDEALTIIARRAEGGMRDALSILDQALSLYPDNHVSQVVAEEITGSIGLTALDSLEVLTNRLADSLPETTLDLAQLPAVPYYTGMMFKVFGDKVPDAFVSGGRYDKLFERFGATELTAVGWAIDIDSVYQAVHDDVEFGGDLDD